MNGLRFCFLTTFYPPFNFGEMGSGSSGWPGAWPGPGTMSPWSTTLMRTTCSTRDRNPARWRRSPGWR